MSSRPFRTVKKHRDLAIPLAESILSSINTALSNRALHLLRTRKYGELVSLEVDPSTYDDAVSFSHDYLAVELMSKFPNFDIGVDRDAVAFEKFRAAEDKCKETNRRMLSSVAQKPLWAEAVVHTAFRKIERLLGPFDWNEACSGFAFGPGSTTRVKRITSDAYYKLSGIPECTHNALLPATATLRYFSSWGRHVASLSSAEQLFAVVRGNKVVTVPKSAKTNRVIAIEPCMNIFMQKGVGAMIRRRLKRVGVNLDDQTLNQRLAREGSVDGSLCTIDLASASDTISLEVVSSLVPADWMEAIHLLRSPQGTLPDGTVITYQKVSSMGNGFTFELESLIFWALCSAVRSLLSVTDRRLAVFGDDIIVPTLMGQALIDVLEFFGFEVNRKKTFLDGPFRESCGKHYFRGTDVTPFYIRKAVDSPLRLYWAANSIKRWSRLSWGLDSLLRQSWSFCYDQVPPRYRFHIPEGQGDGGFVFDFDEATPRTRWNCSLHRLEYSCRFVTEAASTSTSELYPFLLKALYVLERRRGYPTEALSLLPIRTGPSQKGGPSYKVVRKWVPQWPTLGSWLA